MIAFLSILAVIAFLILTPVLGKVIGEYNDPPFIIFVQGIIAWCMIGLIAIACCAVYYVAYDILTKFL